MRGSRMAWFPERLTTQAGVSGVASRRAITASTPILLPWKRVEEEEYSQVVSRRGAAKVLWVVQSAVYCAQRVWIALLFCKAVILYGCSIVVCVIIFEDIIIPDVIATYQDYRNIYGLVSIDIFQPRVCTGGLNTQA